MHSSDELQPGDHIVFQVQRKLCRPTFRSGLVLSVEGRDMKFITYVKEGITEQTNEFHSLVDLHKVFYHSCQHSAETAIERARWRLNLHEKCYHALNNNSHFLVTWSKCGQEYPLTKEILRSLEYQKGDDFINIPSRKKTKKHAMYNCSYLYSIVPMACGCTRPHFQFMHY